MKNLLAILIALALTAGLFVGAGTVKATYTTADAKAAGSCCPSMDSAALKADSGHCDSDAKAIATDKGHCDSDGQTIAVKKSDACGSSDAHTISVKEMDASDCPAMKACDGDKDKSNASHTI